MPGAATSFFGPSETARRATHFWPISWQSMLGLAVWGITCLAARLELAEALLLLAPLVWLPLGLPLVWHGGNSPHAEVPPLLVRSTCSLAALLLVLALWLPVGNLSAALAAPWMLFTWALAARGLWILLRRQNWHPAGIGAGAALLLLSVGGTASLLWRSGQPILWFPAGIILLTGVHFHYAGFIFMAICGQTAARFRARSVRALPLTTFLTIPAVGLGITWWPRVEVVAALALVAQVLLVGLLQLRLATRSADRLTGMLLLLAGLALWFSMPLAGSFAMSEFAVFTSQRAPWITIPTMITTHGLVNGLVFAGAGLLGWRRMCR